ncbi:MAG: hypothetical protein JJ895_04935 [Balneolaceae bacterium]|nr:hypothetical protein [Balneolaceae bacterium]
MSINLKNARKKLLSSQKQGEFVRITFPDFDQEAYFHEEYPIDLNFIDRFGNKHSLRYQKDYVEVDNKLTPISELLDLIYGITEPDGLAVAETYETSFTRVADFCDTPSYHANLAGGYKSMRVWKEGDASDNIIRYHCLSSAGYCIATRDVVINEIGIQWESYGVLRIHPNILQQNPSSVLVTWDPLVADYFNEQGIKALSLPSQNELSHFNYSDLLSESDVYLLADHEGVTFDYSIYPFAELCLKAGISVYRINSAGAFGKQKAEDFLTKFGIEVFENRIRKFSHSLNPGDVPSKKAYNAARSQRIPEIDPAQDIQGNRFFYQIGDTDSVAISNPFRILEDRDLKVFEFVEFRHFEPFRTVCTPDIIQRIQEERIVPFDELFTSTLDFIKRYIYLKEDSWYSVLSAWILGTYFYKAFPAYPYLHFQGIRGSGKTTVLDVIAALSFNGEVKTKATVAAMTELVDLGCATLCVDEFEDFSSSKNTHDDLSRFLNGGYNYKGTYTKKAGKSSQTLHTYSPKAFGGTGGINLDTLSSRTIPIPTKEKPKQIQLDGFMEFDRQVEHQQELIRTSALALPLLHTQIILNTIGSIPTDIQMPISGKKLDNRKFQLATPLIVIGKIIDEMAGTTSNVEQDILWGLDSLWNIELTQDLKKELVLGKLLQSWSDDSEFDAYVMDHGYCWFPKDVWDGTPIREFFPSNTKLYAWLEKMGSIKKGSHHFPHLPPNNNGKQSTSGVGLPLNLNIVNRPFSSWFTKT